jgi:hypothetical protein
MKEDELIQNIGSLILRVSLIPGLDASTFLRFLRLLRNVFSFVAIIGAGLLVVNIVYNMKYVDSNARNALSLLTIQNVSGKWVWCALAASYLFSKS